MKNFLKKYMTEEALAEVEAKYIATHSGATGLPTYVGKERLDEVIGQRDAANAAKKQSEDALTAAQAAHEAAVQKAVAEANAAKDGEIEALKKDFATTEAIFTAKGRNVKAIKALIDPTKKVEDELARLKKDEAYLFHSDSPADDIPSGTGKDGVGTKGNSDAEVAQMRRAVGIG